MMLATIEARTSLVRIAAGYYIHNQQPKEPDGMNAGKETRVLLFGFCD